MKLSTYYHDLFQCAVCLEVYEIKVPVMWAYDNQLLFNEILATQELAQLEHAAKHLFQPCKL